MKHRPIILMTTSSLDTPALQPITADTDIVYSDSATARAVIQAGGLPLYIPAIASITDEQLARYCALTDGVLLTGADSQVNPVRYGESPLPLAQARRVDDERDRIDSVLAQHARADNIPLLGICKGMQVINVALGGTLYQDVHTQHASAVNHSLPKANRANLTHRITIQPDSLAAAIFGNSIVHTNGGHQQAIKDLAPSLSATGTAADGIMEMYEGKGHHFLVGVQFHPELRMSDPQCLALFTRFITASAESNHHE